MSDENGGSIVNGDRFLIKPAHKHRTNRLWEPDEHVTTRKFQIHNSIWTGNFTDTRMIYMNSAGMKW